MKEVEENFQGQNPSRAPARPVLADIPLSWANREIDIEGIRRFFIRYAAQAAVEQLKCEDQHDKR
jgi:hypothetical protein